MDSVIYNIPARMVEAFAGRRVIVRSGDAAELVQHLSQESVLENVLYVQLLSLNGEVDALARWAESLPVDLVMRDPAREFPLLYNFSKLHDKHPVRASIAVRPGFVKAVKLALALNFSVKLEVGQPSPELVEEMAEVLDLYLHRTNVAQPVEYFHSIFLSFYHQEPSSLWFIQEADPEQFRFITDEGEETVSERFAGIYLKDRTGAIVREQAFAPPVKESECDACEFFACCGGYFKWPDKEFVCDGVKTLFGTLEGAAAELRTDLNAFRVSQAGVQL
jgi:hypothetical protein